MQKQFYFKQFSLTKVHSLNVKNSSISNCSVKTTKIKWVQILLCISNNSIKHQSFVYTHLNVKIDLFKITLAKGRKYQNSSISTNSV